jgi:hypothetical protein
MILNASAPRTLPKSRRINVRAQRGVTLLELLIGVGVIIVVMVIVLMGLRNLNGQMDRSALLRHVPQIRATLAGYGSAEAIDLTKLTTQVAINLGAFSPDTVGTNRTSVSNPFGGNIFATGLQADIGKLKSGRAFALSFTSIPVGQCASLARGLATMAEGVWVNDDTTEKPVSALDDAATVKSPDNLDPIAVDKLSKVCAPAGGSTVTVHALIAV